MEQYKLCVYAIQYQAESFDIFHKLRAEKIGIRLHFHQIEQQSGDGQPPKKKKHFDGAYISIILHSFHGFTLRCCELCKYSARAVQLSPIQ